MREALVSDIQHCSSVTHTHTHTHTHARTHARMCAHTHTHTHGLGGLSLPWRGSRAAGRSSGFRKPGSGFQRLRQGLGEAGVEAGRRGRRGWVSGSGRGWGDPHSCSHMKAAQIRAVFYPDVRQRRRGLFCLRCIRLAPHHARSCPQMLTSARRGRAGPLCLPLGANADLRG